MKEKDYLESGPGHKGLESSRFKRGLFIVAGTIFLGLGGIGIFLPICPRHLFYCFPRPVITKALNDYIVGYSTIGGLEVT